MVNELKNIIYTLHNKTKINVSQRFEDLSNTNLTGTETAFRENSLKFYSLIHKNF